MDEEKVSELIKEGEKEAKEILEDEDKLEAFLQRMERKLQVVPMVGDQLSAIPVLASMVKAYAKKEYRNIPLGSILAMISALGYFVAPFDIIPDLFGALGYLDDAAVALACYRMVESDAFEYVQWRKEEGKEIEDPVMEAFMKAKKNKRKKK